MLTIRILQIALLLAANSVSAQPTSGLNPDGAPMQQLFQASEPGVGQVVPCPEFPEISDRFSPGRPHYHYYRDTSIALCNDLQSVGCSVGAVYQVMLSRKEFIAPVDDRSGVENCGVTAVSLAYIRNRDWRCQGTELLVGLGSIVSRLVKHPVDAEPILTVTDIEKRSATNFTLPGHMMHPGMITREIRKIGHNVVVVTTGKGNNSSAIESSLNEWKFLIHCVWGAVNERLRDSVQRMVHPPVRQQSVYPNVPSLFRYREFRLPAKLDQPFNTGIYLEPNEYVYIEGNGRANLGLYTKNVTAAGVRSPTHTLYNKRAFRHGAVFARVGNFETAFRPLFGLANPFYSFLAKDATSSVGDEGVVGAYFLAPAGGELQLDINDTKPEDNSAEFRIRVITIKTEAHHKRNLFNKCEVEERLLKSDEWEDEYRVFSGWYHGFENRSYRGKAGSNLGCQCVYNASDGLLVRGRDKGSFDIGNWLFGKAPLGAEHKNFLHLIFDVLPHDLYVAQVGVASYQGD